MFKLTEDKLPALAIGATMLGSGGGGNPKILYDLVHYQLQKYGAVNILSIDEIKPDQIVVPLAFVGAPLVSLEKIPNIKIFDKIFAQLQKLFPARQIVLMPTEIGGCNALTPLLIAGKYQLPVLDADIIGRAFPEINMCKPMVLNCSNDPTILADTAGNLVILHLTEPNKIEEIVRNVIPSLGLSAGIATFICSGEQAKSQVIEGSISLALKLGEAWSSNQKTPLNFFEITNTKLLATGMINDVFYDLSQGFVEGYVTVSTLEGIVKVFYQNEFLLVKQGDKVLAGSPNIITLIDAKTGLLITAEALTYGITVLVICIPAPDFWLTETAKPHVDYKNICAKELL
ncbi:MAG: hypothetical protein K0S08_592 [Gammaproteobacteria bacterium]|jgi:DUF917 family protein|nr:hypothetical protein [Gammaproteobacteria bacterium]